MIELPKKGIANSVNVHNCDDFIFCDWIEASSLFLGKEVAGSDLVDILTETNVYQSQSFAWEFVSSCLSTIDQRSKIGGQGYPFEVNNSIVTNKDQWTEFTPYAFCLMLSLAKSHGKWLRDTFGADYTVQGELFEKLTAESVLSSFPGWKTHPTGWTRTQTNHIKQVVEGICDKLNEAAGTVFHWTAETTKEAGLDLVSYRPFSDGNVGVPVFLWQCASGMDWVDKRKTPDLALWAKLVSWAVLPKKAMSMPFALNETSMRQNSVFVEGLLLDRLRLLEPGKADQNWITDQLKTDIIAWLNPRVLGLPKLQN